MKQKTLFPTKLNHVKKKTKNPSFTTTGDADDTPDEQTGGDSSKSNSVTSEHSLHSVGVSASSQSSSTNSLPAGGCFVSAGGGINSSSMVMAGSGGGGGGGDPTQDHLRLRRGPGGANHAAAAAMVAEHGTNNFATIRTTSIVTKQQKEHMQEEMHEQMTGYKRMRREHQGALLKLEERCKMEMEQHKSQLDKEYEALLQTFSRELERLQVGAVVFFVFVLFFRIFRSEVRVILAVVVLIDCIPVLQVFFRL